MQGGSAAHRLQGFFRLRGVLRASIFWSKAKVLSVSVGSTQRAEVDKGSQEEKSLAIAA